MHSNELPLSLIPNIKKFLFERHPQSFRFMKLTLERQIPLVFTIAMILLAIIAFFAFRSMNHLTQAIDQEKHTHKVLTQLDETLISLLNAETAVRGYAIRGDESLLAPFRQTEKEIGQNLEVLKSLIGDNPEQIERFRQLENIANVRMKYLTERIELRKNKDLVEYSQLPADPRGVELSNSVRSLIGEMEKEEMRLLTEREADLERNLAVTYRMIYVAGLAGILSLAFANFAIYREIKKRSKAEDDLRDANKGLESRVEERTREISQKNDELKEQILQREHSENRHRVALEAGNLGTWFYSPGSGKAEMDARSFTLFDVTEEDFQGHGKKVFSKILREDARGVRKAFRNSMDKNENLDVSFRYTLRDGKVRWLQCTGQPQTNGDGTEKHFVGHCRDITESKNAEGIIRASEIFTRSILDSLPAHIAVIDKNGVIVSVNDAWENFASQNCLAENLQLTGIGQNYLQVCEKDQSFNGQTNSIIENLCAVLEGKSDGFAVEYPCAELWFVLQASALKGDDGGAVISHINITDRKLAEKELKNSEEFTRSIFENSPDCVKVLDLDGNLHSMNNNGLCIMEIDDFNDYVGKNWVDFWEGEENELAYQAVESARNGKTANFEGFCLTTKGTPKWWDVSVSPIFDASGKPIRLISTSRDVTERKEAEKSRFHLAAIVESSSDAIVSKDLNGTITSWNDGAENLFGYTAEEVIGKSITLLIPTEHLDEEPQILERIRRGEKIVLFETIRQRKDKSKVDVSLTVSPIFDYAGKIIGASKIAHDITERKQAEAERERLLEREQNARKDAEIANRLRDEFLATVSHELRAPLNSILGWARLMEKGTLDEKTTEKAIATIVRNAESQNRLIEDLLDVSRIISGKMRLEVMTVKPSNFVEAALETVRPAAEAKNIALEVVGDQIVSHISGDPNRLQQVMWNLLSNAIKFTSPGGRVVVEINRESGNVEIKVKDTGVGIKEEFLPHVFDRFRQADASSIRKFGGLGLGLAIVRHITEMHGGTVDVESAGENQGATFTVSLPVVSSPEDEEIIELNEANREPFFDDESKPDLDGLLILVVDDEQDTRQLLVQSLTLYGATVITAKSAEEGLQQIVEKSPDVLVSDIGMPDEDGYSLIKKVRALEDENQRNITAIALTAFTRAQDRMRALASGFHNHVGKPVEPDELVTVIASLKGKL